MFTELDLSVETAQDNIEDIYVKSLNVLCSESMFILQNNSKVLKYLTDETSSKELDMLVKSAYMAIKRNRFELFQNILLGLKNQVHKLAALEIKYFDEYETLLRSDVFRTFVPQNFQKHAFMSPALKEVFEIFNETVKLSPTNAAFALKTAIESGEQNFVNDVLLKGELKGEFIRQIHKRYHANFGMTIDEDIKNNSKQAPKADVIQNILSKAV
ncbi:MAG: hypothetical protein K6A44_02685 [bacterium]|nr:hypothetical protein [bacterium]